MTEPALALQAAVRTRLAGSGVLTSLVPAKAILDANQRPSVIPAIIIGEGQTVPDDGLARDRHRVFLDFHVWAEEPGTVFIKQVVGAMRGVFADMLWTVPGFEVADAHITSARFMRDPDSIHSHAVVTLECRVRELA